MEVNGKFHSNQTYNARTRTPAFVPSCRLAADVHCLYEAEWLSSCRWCHCDLVLCCGDVIKRMHAHTHTDILTPLLSGGRCSRHDAGFKTVSKCLVNDRTDRRMTERETVGSNKRHFSPSLLHTHTHTQKSYTSKFNQPYPYTPTTPTHIHCGVELRVCVCGRGGLLGIVHSGEPPAAWLSYKHLRFYSSYSGCFHFIFSFIFFSFSFFWVFFLLLDLFFLLYFWLLCHNTCVSLAEICLYH